MDMQKIVEEVWCSRTNYWRTAIPFIEKYIVSAAKKNWSIFIWNWDCKKLLQILKYRLQKDYLRLQKIVSGQKSQILCKIGWNKNCSKTCGRWKKNPSAELVEPVLEKVDRKPFALAKTFWPIKLSMNQDSSFWYGAFTSFSLEIFDSISVLETNMSSYTQEVFASTSLEQSSIDFEFELDRNLD